MTLRLTLTLVATLLFVSGCGPCPSGGADGSDLAATQRYYERLIAPDQIDVAGLTLFFTRMPKGGDLHHHYSGSLYAETYLDWVAAKHWRINACTLKVDKTPYANWNDCPTPTYLPVADAGDCKLMEVADLRKDDASYRKLLTLWSDKDYANHDHEQPPPDANFFNTFGYFGAVSGEFMHAGLEILKQRARAENVSYIETMLSTVPVDAKVLFTSDQIARVNTRLRGAADQTALNGMLKELIAALAAKPGFEAAIKTYLERVNAVHAGIDDDAFSMRFQAYAVRTLDPLSVFLQLYAGYLAAEKSPLVVGVNIVAPENNDVALADYTLHMRMFHFLSQLYPQVHRALHAGELTLGMVRPQDLRFHIREAREIAGAERIGHGVDLPYESDVPELLADLKAHAAIEINLTSNEFILGVAGNAHPYRLYAAYGVPMVISTDDSGVSRNNLSHQYVLLATRYRPAYAQIKRYVYNSLSHAFLDEEEKAAQKSRLDERFQIFEKDMAALAAKFGDG